MRPQPNRGSIKKSIFSKKEFLSLRLAASQLLRTLLLQLLVVKRVRVRLGLMELSQLKGTIETAAGLGITLKHAKTIKNLLQNLVAIRNQKQIIIEWSNLLHSLLYLVQSWQSAQLAHLRSSPVKYITTIKIR